MVWVDDRWIAWGVSGVENVSVIGMSVLELGLTLLDVRACSRVRIL